MVKIKKRGRKKEGQAILRQEATEWQVLLRQKATEWQVLLRQEASAGQALIESIVAMGIIVTGVLGAFSFFSSSISLNRLVTNQYAAIYKAASIIELYKHCVDVKGWGVDCSKEVIGEDATVESDKIWAEEIINNTVFTKSVTTLEGEGFRTVKVNVSWKEKGDLYNVNLEDRFYKWR